MKTTIKSIIFILSMLILSPISAQETTLPAGFVYLHDIDPTIIQEIRYASSYNFVGRPITGYTAASCILTKPAAQALAKVQAALQSSHLSLRVYDCYRPQSAVNDFIQWSQQANQQKMKAVFYPNIDKSNLFRLGYIAAKSGHSRGSTVDLTINHLAMGSGYDFMDNLSHNDNKTISKTAWNNRQLLKKTMQKYGFIPYKKEWWHFTLQNEPFPKTYFDFPVTASAPSALGQSATQTY